MSRDHYFVLGISPSETEGGIHAAFRVLAKRYHPDVAGQQAASRFREVVEAYEVLSDPERRRRYDERLGEVGPVVPEAPSSQPWRHAGRAEPLIPEPLSLANDFELLCPSRSDLLQRVRRNFMGGAPKGERLEALNVVVLIPREKARAGGVITVGVPVFHRCRYCRGTGRDWPSDCVYCDGTGELAIDEPVRVDVQPFASRRAVLDVPLSDLGIHNFYLRLQLQVAS